MLTALEMGELDHPRVSKWSFAPTRSLALEWINNINLYFDASDEFLAATVGYDQSQSQFFVATRQTPSGNTRSLEKPTPTDQVLLALSDSR